MTLFLDRDGVINERTPGEYVKNVAEFHFMPGVLEAFPLLSKHFEWIFVVTNQAGVGKGLMTRLDVESIHESMKNEVEAAGGRIDAIYYCPHTPANRCYCRKPEPGMAWDAKSKHQNINYPECWMVGDSASDMLFGQQLGMKTALVPGKHEDESLLVQMEPTMKVGSLLEFAKWIELNA